MIIFSIIIIVSFAIGIRLLYTWNYDGFGFILVVVFGLISVFHFPFLLLKTYTYEVFVEERNAFEYTLKEARENGRELESAAISKEVAKWNTSLASRKYDNTTLLLDMYVDDRIMDLEPIK